MRAWVRGAAFFGSGVPFRVPRRHVVVFSARKRQNRRFGAGGEGDAAFEFAKRFSRPGLSLGAMVLKDPKPPHLCLRPAPNRNILHIRAHFPTRCPRLDVFPGVTQIREVPVAYPEVEPRRRTGKGSLPCNSELSWKRVPPSPLGDYPRMPIRRKKVKKTPSLFNILGGGEAFFALGR